MLYYYVRTGSFLYALLFSFGMYADTATVTPEQVSEKTINYLATSEATFRLIDGMPSPFGIDYHYFGLMRMMDNSLMGILHGDKKNPGYDFEGAKYTLEQLVILEQECKGAARHAELMECLQVIKHDFEIMVKPFLDCARRSPKGPVLHLMHASCELHNTPNSSILKWAVAQEGNELIFFHTELVTLHDVRNFFTDLSNFLKYMLAHCPKAKKQFIDMAQKKLADTCNQQKKS